MLASDAAKSMDSDITKTKTWKVGFFVILTIFALFMTGTSILSSQSEYPDHSKVRKVAFEVYTKYSQQLDTIRDKN